MILVLAGMATLCIRADAQVRFGSVLGVVADPSGATMSGANVKITNLGTNETRSTQTGTGGTFTFPNLNAGLYRVEVEMAGFKRFTQDRVEVQVDVATRVEARLQVGVVTESVVVTTEGPPLQTDSASLGTTISQQECFVYRIARKKHHLAAHVVSRASGGHDIGTDRTRKIRK